MVVAQKLYESGKITYMRTDSVNLSNEAIGAAKAEITKAYGSEFSQVRKYATKSKGAQEAHEAIRPTLPLRSPDVIASEVLGVIANLKQRYCKILMHGRGLKTRSLENCGTKINPS